MSVLASRFSNLVSLPLLGRFFEPNQTKRVALAAPQIHNTVSEPTSAYSSTTGYALSDFMTRGGKPKKVSLTDYIAHGMQGYRKEVLESLKPDYPWHEWVSPFTFIASEVTTGIFMAPFVSFGLKSMLNNSWDFSSFEYLSLPQMGSVLIATSFLASYLFGSKGLPRGNILANVPVLNKVFSLPVLNMKVPSQIFYRDSHKWNHEDVPLNVMATSIWEYALQGKDKNHGGWGWLHTFLTQGIVGLQIRTESPLTAWFYDFAQSFFVFYPAISWIFGETTMFEVLMNVMQDEASLQAVIEFSHMKVLVGSLTAAIGSSYISRNWASRTEQGKAAALRAMYFFGINASTHINPDTIGVSNWTSAGVYLGTMAVLFSALTAYKKIDQKS